LHRKKLINHYQLALPSPIQEILLDGHPFYLKRDDLIDPHFSGNKARKFYTYLSSDYSQIQKVISYGSNQSNAMYSLSVLAKLKGWEFDYYVDHVPEYLRENPQGNYRRSLENGMQIEEDSIDMNSLGDEILAIQEGGRDREAELGIKILADEIATWQKDQGIEKLNIFLPSGTGTTALYLQKNSQNRVYTTPCVGDDTYLKKQFTMLVEDEKYHPTILNIQKRYHFGKLYKDFYKIWLKLQQETKVEFDLLYDPKGWMVVMDNLDIFSLPTLYIHQGGLVGNESMLPRYERKYKEQIQ